MEFDPTQSFEDNLQLFKTELEKLDADCAKILFDNIDILCREGDSTRLRSTTTEFNRSVLQALATLPDKVTDE